MERRFVEEQVAEKLRGGLCVNDRGFFDYILELRLALDNYERACLGAAEPFACVGDRGYSRVALNDLLRVSLLEVRKERYPDLCGCSDLLKQAAYLRLEYHDYRDQTPLQEEVLKQVGHDLELTQPYQQIKQRYQPDTFKQLSGAGLAHEPYDRDEQQGQQDYIYNVRYGYRHKYPRSGRYHVQNIQSHSSFLKSTIILIITRYAHNCK